MSKNSPCVQSSFARRNRRLAAAIEGLESRAYLNGAVFGSPKNTSVTGAVYTDLVDLNGDGKADLITSNVATEGNSVSVLLGNGDGTFGAAQTFPVSFSPLTIVDGSFGASGKLIAVGSTNNNSVEVLIENTVSSTPSFTTQTLTATNLMNTRSITLGDFLGNGRQDIAVASLDNNTGSSSNNVAIFRNNGDGTFTDVQTLSVPHAQVASITSFTQANGVMDLAVADANDSAVTVLLNNGSGSFSVGPDYSVGNSQTPVTIKSGKFDQANNNDQNDDLVTANATGGNVTVLLGNGDGTFNPTPKVTTVTGAASGGGPLKVRVANLNADSNPDLLGLLSAGSSADGEVLLGNGDGTFHVGSEISVGGGPFTSIAAGDLAGNGLAGLVLANTSVVTALVNVTNQDHTPPTATISPASTSGIGSPTIQFVVNYSDDTQVDATTLNSGNITVTDPSGNARPVTLVSSNLANGATVSATYSIPATGNSLGPGDNGPYTVTATSNTAAAAKDANGNPLAGGMLGTFTVAVATSGPNLVAGAVNVHNPATAVAGTRFAGATSVVVVNSGNLAAKNSIVIQLFASPSQTIAAGTQPLESVTRKINLKPGARTVLSLPGFTWPAGLAGTEFLVADVNATQTITETNYSDNLGISAKSTAVSLPFVDINNLWNGKLPAALKVGRRVVIPDLLQNLGNTAARGMAAFTIQAADANNPANIMTVGTGSVRLNIPPKARQAVALPLTLPSALASGTYHLLVTVSFPGDTNAGNDTVSSTTTFTV